MVTFTTNRPNTIATLEWLARRGGRASHFPLLHPSDQEIADLDASYLLVAPAGEICDVRPSTFELMDGYWFTLYEDNEGAKWACITIHPDAYAGLVEEARVALASPAAA